MTGAAEADLRAALSGGLHIEPHDAAVCADVAERKALEGQGDAAATMAPPGLPSTMVVEAPAPSIASMQPAHPGARSPSVIA